MYFRHNAKSSDLGSLHYLYLGTEVETNFKGQEYAPNLLADNVFPYPTIA